MRGYHILYMDPRFNYFTMTSEKAKMCFIR